MKSTGRNPFQVFRDQWAFMSLYERSSPSFCRR